MGRVRNRKRKRTRSLGAIFTGYVLGMTAAMIGWGFFMIIMFNISIFMGDVRAANYPEIQIGNMTGLIRTVDEVTPEIIPDSCKYAVLDTDGEFISGDLPEEYIDEAKDVALWGTTSGEYYYKVIARDHEYVVLQYELKAQFRNQWLREHLPDPENIMFMAIIVGTLAIIQLSSLRFGRRIRRNMTPVMEATQKIGARDLEFQVDYSGVKEIDDCLKSIDDMRYALKTSLTEQWSAEQEKNRQMSALAHDIKTPLTVVRGNAELLQETSLDEEQKSYADYITGSVHQIESYVQTLIDVTKSQEGVEEPHEDVPVKELLSDLKKQSQGLVQVYSQSLNWSENYSAITVNIAYNQVVRAVMNIIRNAAEHSPEGSNITVDIAEKYDELRFTVTDSGKGFTQEALKHGTEQFFMGDSSRTGGSHYGIGLFFAKKVAENHGGKINLTNKEESSNGCVEFSIKL